MATVLPARLKVQDALESNPFPLIQTPDSLIPNVAPIYTLSCIWGVFGGWGAFIIWGKGFQKEF